VTIGAEQPFCIIGERINPTGRKRFAEELRNGNLETVTFDAVNQVQAGANMLGLGDRLGSLQPGKLADLVLLRLDRPHAVPLFDPYSHLAYVLHDSDVDTVVVNGQVIYDAGRLTLLDPGDALAEVQALAARIQAWRAGSSV
jgi:5-methylthioadenosine/S-adenosylhomocysteine deaminase